MEASPASFCREGGLALGEKESREKITLNSPPLRRLEVIFLSTRGVQTFCRHKHTPMKLGKEVVSPWTHPATSGMYTKNGFFCGYCSPAGPKSLGASRAGLPSSLSLSVSQTRPPQFLSWSQFSSLLHSICIEEEEVVTAGHTDLNKMQGSQGDFRGDCV